MNFFAEWPTAQCPADTQFPGLYHFLEKVQTQHCVRAGGHLAEGPSAFAEDILCEEMNFIAGWPAAQCPSDTKRFQKRFHKKSCAQALDTYFNAWLRNVDAYSVGAEIHPSSTTD